MKKEVADIREDYTLKTLSETEAAPTPVAQFDKWWKDAVAAKLTEVNAMTLATVDTDGTPAARIMLLKDYGERGFCFYTNYDSHKGQQLLQNPKACLVFFWKELQRQVRVTGTVEKLSEEESKKYFFSRPVPSQIGALVSHQSEVIPNRPFLEEKKHAIETAVTGGEAIQKPDYWGGFLVKPTVVEFWQGGAGRLHDRLQYTLQADGQWLIERLSP
ncbi:MAG: pyridoxamine 5'-phosphate oxidase [Niabella sp.]